MERKLKLNLDDLRVESFTTTGPPAQQPGTVFGLASAPDVCPCEETAWEPCNATQDAESIDGCDDETNPVGSCYTNGCGGGGATFYPNTCASGLPATCHSYATCYNYPSGNCPGPTDTCGDTCMATAGLCCDDTYNQPGQGCHSDFPCDPNSFNQQCGPE